MQILVVATRVEVPAGVRNLEKRNAKINLTQRQNWEKDFSFAILMYMACAMDARGRVYEVGPLPL